MLSVPGGGKVLAMFRYEHLPNFCYACGRLDHQEQDCNVVVRMKKEGKKPQREYGAWLRAEGPDYKVSKEGGANSRSEGESFSSLPMRQKGEKKNLEKDKEITSGENNRELWREGPEKGAKEVSRWSDGQQNTVKVRQVKNGGKEIDSNPEKDGNQQPPTCKSSKVVESNLIREVDKLVENLDLVDPCQDNPEIKGLMGETLKEGNSSSISISPRNKRLPTWKRSVRSYTRKTSAERVSSNACNRKRANIDTGVDSLKKPREMDMVDITELNSKKAEVGENQPRCTL